MTEFWGLVHPGPVLTLVSAWGRYLMAAHSSGLEQGLSSKGIP